MSQVTLNDVVKVYPGGVKAVDRVSLAIEPEELIVLVGPSGCGKSTTLRMVAGLEDITAGTISIGGRVVNDVPPKDRNIAMVFQNYALYPHMTVYKNMAFSLKLRRKELGLNRKEIDDKVRKAAKLLGIEDLLDRRPKALSGGQRQRVAVGRAIVRSPSVFLFDEPLSNLDAKLRVEMRSEIKRIQRRFKTTTIYVTHDQEEAMTLATRIAVMNAGRFVQVGTPGEIYEHPSNRFVADFVGKINLLEGVVADFADGNPVVRCNATPEPIVLPHDGTVARGDSVCVAVRPEKIYITKEAPEEAANRTVIRGVVFDLAYFGNLSLYRVKTEGGKVIDVSAQNRRREARRAGGEQGGRGEGERECGEAPEAGGPKRRLARHARHQAQSSASEPDSCAPRVSCRKMSSRSVSSVVMSTTLSPAAATARRMSGTGRSLGRYWNTRRRGAGRLTVKRASDSGTRARSRSRQSASSLLSSCPSSAAVVSQAITRPWLMMAMRSQSCSASSR